MATLDVPAPPPGFTIDTDTDVPTPPAGFTLDGAGPSPPAPHTLGQKIGFGISDVLTGLSQAFAHRLPIDPGMTMQQEQDRNDLSAQNAPLADAQAALREQTWQANRAANNDKGFEYGRLGGNIIGAAPMVLAAAPVAPESFLSALGLSGFSGGVNAGLQPVTNGDYGKEKGKQIGFGTAGGAATGGLTYGLGGLVAGPKPPTDDYGKAVQYLQDRGVQPTVGQLGGQTAAKVEDVAQPLSVFGQERAVKQFNTAAYNQVLAPIGAKFDGTPGRDAVRVVGDKLSDAYNEIVPQLRLVPDQQLQTDFAAAVSKTDEMSEAAADQFSKIITKQLPRGPMEGETLKKVQSKLTDLVDQFNGSQDPSHKMMADAFSDIRTAISENLARVNPEMAGKLQAIDHGWANLTRLEIASAKTNDGVFTPAQLLSAARQADSTVRRRAIARGMGGDMQDLADAGIKVLGTKYPNSGTPARLAVGALESGGLGALGMAHPLTALGLASTGLAYTPWGQQAVNALAMPRTSQVSTNLGRAIQASGPVLGRAAGRFLLGRSGQ